MLKNFVKGIVGEALFDEPVAVPASKPATTAVGHSMPASEHQMQAPTTKPIEKPKLKKLTLGCEGQGMKGETVPIPFPPKLENRHFLIGGTTGAGKTRIFFQLADQARERGDKALIVDHGMEQVMRNWRPGDVILNPFDDRFPGWTPFNEVDAPWDCENLGKSIIPDGVGAAAEWNAYAQALMSAIIKKIIESADSDGMCSETNDELIRWVGESTENLQKFCEGDPISAMLDPANAKMVASIRGIVASKLAPFRHLENGDFSIRDWMMNDNDPRWVYICYKDEMLGSLRSLISGWVSLAVMYMLSLPEDENRRIWLFLDELASLDKIGALTDALAKARKRGGCVVAGLQTVSQMNEKYGDAGAQTLMANFGTWITLRAGDAETAEAFSKHFGEQEIWQDSFSEGMNLGQGATLNDGANLQLKRQRVVEYTELMQLKDLQGFVKIPGPYPAGEITAPILPKPKDRGAPAFIPATKGKAAYQSRREAKRQQRSADLEPEMSR